MAIVKPETFYRRGLPSVKIQRPKVTKKKLSRNVMEYYSLYFIPMNNIIYQNWSQSGKCII